MKYDPSYHGKILGIPSSNVVYRIFNLTDEIDAEVLHEFLKGTRPGSAIHFEKEDREQNSPYIWGEFESPWRDDELQALERISVSSLYKNLQETLSYLSKLENAVIDFDKPPFE